MNNLKLIAALLLITTTSFAQDMFLQTRVEKGTLSALVDKTRVLLANSEIDDHMKGEVELTEDVSFPLNELASDTNYDKFRDMFSSVFKIDLSSAVVRIRVPKIYYAVDELHATPHSMNVQDPYLTLKVTAAIRGIITSLTNGVDLDLMITNPKTSKLESYLTAHLAPTTITIPKTLEPVSFGVEFQTKRDHEFSYTLKGYDFEAIPSYIDRNMKSIQIMDTAKQTPISADSISVNPVTVRLSSLTRTINFDTFKPLLQKKLDTVISTIVTKLGLQIQEKIGPRILKTVFSSKTSSDLIVTNESLYTRFVTSNFSQPTSDQLYLGVIGELCTTESYQQYHEQCNQHGNFPAPVRSISDGDRLKANTEITENLARGQSDLILSMSEEYLNKLLHTTIQANLWNDSLKDQNLAVGPKGAFIVLDQRTKNPELYIDLLYKGEGKGVENLLVNERKPIRFPMRVSTSLEFVNKDGVPHMILKTEKVLSDLNEIINGIPKYDLQSKLVFGLKKKVARMILEMSGDIEGQTAVDLELPSLKGIDLEKSWYEASPFGRLNLFFKL